MKMQSNMEEEWIYNMRRLIKWALKKGFETDYPYPILLEELSEKVADITKDCFYELLSIGEIEHYEHKNTRPINR